MENELIVRDCITDLVIPALNEEGAIGKVVLSVPKALVRNIIVVDNGSTDDTVSVAGKQGAIVLSESERGYGAACLRGIEYSISQPQPPDVIAFMDGDFSDHAEEIDTLIDPIKHNIADLVLGSRVMGKREKGSLTPQQVVGNKIATSLLKYFYDQSYTDLGPFRAIRTESLLLLQMKDRNYGWTVEMQIKAAKNKLRILEVPVSYRNRIGYSKVSGTIKGSVMAGYKIIHTLLKHS